MFFDTIILTCCARFQAGRSISAVFHLLKGKRSIQTVQDAHLYQLEQFYGIYPTLRKRSFDERIQKLEKNGYLPLRSESAAVPTQEASSWMDKQKEKTAASIFQWTSLLPFSSCFSGTIAAAYSDTNKQ